MSEGEIYEQLFTYMAMQKGFKISKPIRSNTYDLILDKNNSLKKVQVKSSSVTKKNAVTFSTKKGRNICYEKNDVDFFALYDVTRSIWFIIPFESIEGKKGIDIYYSEGTKYIKFKEAWGLLEK